MTAHDWQAREDERNGEALTDILCGVVAGLFFGAACMGWIILSFSLGALVHL